MKEAKMIPKQPLWGGHVSTRATSFGYVVSLALTLGAFLLVEYRLLQGWILGAALFFLAILQVWVQLVCFFNLGREEKPRWNTTAFFFMLLVLVIVVVGSLFIMQSLNYRMMI